jgi:hypothetical protein
MIDLKENLLFGKSYCGIEHTSDEEDGVRSVLVIKTRKELKVALESSVNSIEELDVILPKNQHSFLIVNTDQVLSKKIQGQHSLKDAVLKAFPNIHMDQFYIEAYTNQNDTFVSICRKEVIDSLLETYRKSKIEIIGFSLGNLVVSEITNYLTKSNIQTSNARIEIGGNQIQEITPFKTVEKRGFEINGIKLHSYSINPFSGVLSYLARSQVRLNNFDSIELSLKKRFIQERMFSFGLKSSLGFVFVLLLINFLVFSYYNEKVNSSINEMTNYQLSSQRLSELEKEVEKKKMVYHELNSSGNGRVSFYMDRIANSIPKSIILHQVVYQPLKKGIRENKELEFDSDGILISGESSFGEEFSKWIVDLETFEWIDNVIVQEYGMNKSIKNKFQIALTLNHEN